jgi:hypothetical protein
MEGAITNKITSRSFERYYSADDFFDIIAKL